MSRSGKYLGLKSIWFCEIAVGFRTRKSATMSYKRSPVGTMQITVRRFPQVRRNSIAHHLFWPENFWEMLMRIVRKFVNETKD